MTAADTIVRPSGAVLAVENVVLTVTDGETYTTRMSRPFSCQITSAEDMGAETNSASYTISGRIITIYADGVSDKKMALTIYGSM